DRRGAVDAAGIAAGSRLHLDDHRIADAVGLEPFDVGGRQPVDGAGGADLRDDDRVADVLLRHGDDVGQAQGRRSGGGGDAGLVLAVVLVDGVADQGAGDRADAGAGQGADAGTVHGAADQSAGAGADDAAGGGALFGVVHAGAAARQEGRQQGGGVDSLHS